MNSWDVIITGAGLIGVSLGLELHGRGAKVLLLDRGEPGKEASSAAAGMLAPSDPETLPALQPLALESARMFPEYVRRLENLSGMSVDFRSQGTIVFGDSASVSPSYHALSGYDLRRLEPLIRNHGHTGFLVQEGSVDPRLLMRAALSAAQACGLEIRSNTEAQKFHWTGSHVEVLTDSGTFTGAAAVNCRGAWSGMPVRPRKGQMLYVQPSRPVLQHVLRAPEVYIVPRSTGKVLVGATVEDVGYDKRVEISTIQDLLKGGAQYLPELASSPIVDSWAGLRPGTPDDLPILGPTDTPGVFVASGHFRNGILLAPITARIMADLIIGKTPNIEIAPFAASRFASVKA
ncbi:MAG: glycine oxidase ThiO [Candidatus Angelobacter sp.]